MHSHVTNDETAAHIRMRAQCKIILTNKNRTNRDACMHAKNRGLLAGARSKYPYQARDFLILGIDL
jgi:hypothetical protein